MFLHRCTVLSDRLNLGSPPTSYVRVLTSDRALERVVLVKSDDRHFIGWPALVFPILLVTQTTAEAHRSEATQEKQRPNDHQQPVRTPPSSESSVVWRFSQLWRNQSSVSPFWFLFEYFIERLSDFNSQVFSSRICFLILPARLSQFTRAIHDRFKCGLEGLIFTEVISSLWLSLELTLRKYTIIRRCWPRRWYWNRKSWYIVTQVSDGVKKLYSTRC